MFWYTRRTLGMRSQTPYEDNIKKIVDFTTVKFILMSERENVIEFITFIFIKFLLLGFRLKAFGCAIAI